MVQWYIRWRDSTRSSIPDCLKISKTICMTVQNWKNKTQFWKISTICLHGYGRQIFMQKWASVKLMFVFSPVKLSAWLNLAGSTCAGCGALEATLFHFLLFSSNVDFFVCAASVKKTPRNMSSICLPTKRLHFNHTFQFSVAQTMLSMMGSTSCSYVSTSIGPEPGVAIFRVFIDKSSFPTHTVIATMFFFVR